MDKLRTPFGVVINLTHLCNLACPFCYYRKFQQAGRRDLPVEEWCRFLDELAGLGVVQISIIGGEPLVYNGFPVFVDRLVENRMRFQLVSNGFFMAERGEAVFRHRRRCNWVQVSVDGMRRTHDRLRGEGTWERAIQALRLLKSQGISTRVNMTVSTLNVDDIPELVPFLAESAGVDVIRLNSVVECPGAPLLDGVAVLPLHRMSELIDVTLELARRIPQLSPDSTPLKLASQLKHPRRISGEAAPFHCSSPWHRLAVRADGALLPCDGCENRVLGWANRTSVQELWNDEKLMEPFRATLLEGRRVFSDDCALCPFSWYCSSACPEQPERPNFCLKELAELRGVATE